MKAYMFITAVILTLSLNNAFSQNAGSTDSNNETDNLDLNRLQTLVTDIKDENVQLQDRLQVLEGYVIDDNLNVVLETVNKEKFKSEIRILYKMYEAGENILYHIIRETNNFNLSYKHLILQNQFNSIVNPINYPGFTIPLKTTLNSLGDKKPTPDIQSDLSNFQSIVPFVTNPLLSSGVSIVSYFLAKYNKRSKIGNADFEKMMCVLNFTTTAADKYNVNVNAVRTLSEKIDNYNAKLKVFFESYLKSIGYTAGYDAYIESKGSEGKDFLKPTRDEFFNTLLADTTNIGALDFMTESDDNASFYIEQVKFHLNEYEALLLDIESSIARYEEFVNSLSELATSSCEGVRQNTNEAFLSIKESIDGVKKAFLIVSKENRVPGSQKRTLFGL
ncbi:MAG TPA: hypothetical protein VKZ51_05830 [Cyclobacteriaceae bacterium]|nr:hypothetical protein [Cyclobacteriaceae bacterium]